MSPIFHQHLAGSRVIQGKRSARLVRAINDLWQNVYGELSWSFDGDVESFAELGTEAVPKFDVKRYLIKFCGKITAMKL